MFNTRVVNSESYKELERFYSDVYSIGSLGHSLQNRLVAISLICLLTYKAKQKKPGVTAYQIIMTICEKSPLPEDYAWRLAIVCEDFMYGCKDFPTFGLKKEEIIPTVQKILNDWLPF